MRPLPLERRRGSRAKEYEAFAAALPRTGPTNAVDWEAAEARGLLHSADHVEGISISRPPLVVDRDVTIPSRA